MTDFKIEKGLKLPQIKRIKKLYPFNHMIRSSKQLVGLPVHTVSGLDLGQLSEFDIETETGRIKQIRVKPSGLVKGLIRDELLINWSQIIEIRTSEIIVDDVVSSQRAGALVQSVSAAPMAMASDMQQPD